MTLSAAKPTKQTTQTIQPTQPTHHTVINSPIGELLLLGNESALTGLHFAPYQWTSTIIGNLARDDGPFQAVSEQLREYFAGDRKTFDLPVALAGTPFQQRVWAMLQEIPYGRTATYGEIATRLGHPNAARAVGMANNRNPVAVIVPCHRVVGSNGALVGYGGGLDRKRMLLELEAGVLALPAS
jgi:methylated-DNA-[protein]-cysteine S-methyltransferase